MPFASTGRALPFPTGGRVYVAPRSFTIIPDPPYEGRKRTPLFSPKGGHPGIRVLIFDGRWLLLAIMRCLAAGAIQLALYYLRLLIRLLIINSFLATLFLLHRCPKDTEELYRSYGIQIGGYAMLFAVSYSEYALYNSYFWKYWIPYYKEDNAATQYAPQRPTTRVAATARAAVGESTAARAQVGANDYHRWTMQKQLRYQQWLVREFGGNPARIYPSRPFLVPAGDGSGRVVWQERFTFARARGGTISTGLARGAGVRFGLRGATATLLGAAGPVGLILGVLTALVLELTSALDS